MEANESLGPDEGNGPLWKAIDQQVEIQESLERELKEVEDKEVYGEITQNCEDKQDIWEDLRGRLGDGDTVFAPSSRRRMTKVENAAIKKKQKRSGDNDDDLIVNDVIEDGSENERDEMDDSS